MGNKGKRSRERWVPRQEQKDLDKIERRKIAKEEIRRDLNVERRDKNGKEPEGSEEE
tara:strand:- start:240 stop:410 length:171 start_codon:yes stop_codon:yes gene_type:complete